MSEADAGFFATDRRRMLSFVTSVDGTRIAYEADGAGPPELVLVHGWSCNRRYWDAQVAHLAPHALIITLDLAGHGDSGVMREDWSIERFGADVAAVVIELALRDVVLVGHSMGADVILEASRILKNRVRGLVWVDQYSQLSSFMSEAEAQARVEPFRSAFAETTRAFVRRMFSPAADSALVQRVCEQICSSPPEVAIPALEATWNHGRAVPALLSSIGLPVVTINAAEPPTDLESMNRHGVKVILMRDAGHFPMLERPREFDACLLQAIDLLSKHTDGA